MAEKPSCYTCVYCEESISCGLSSFTYCRYSPLMYQIGQKREPCKNYKHTNGETTEDRIIRRTEYARRKLKESRFTDEEINKMIIDVAKLD